MSATEGKPPSKIVEFPSPKPETTPEENIRQQMAEAQRLANLAPGEYLLWAPDSAQRLGMPVEQLVAAVQAILVEREKEANEAKAEARRREQRVSASANKRVLRRMPHANAGRPRRHSKL